jgi:hypothetical protein
MLLSAWIWLLKTGRMRGRKPISPLDPALILVIVTPDSLPRHKLGGVFANRRRNLLAPGRLSGYHPLIQEQEAFNG